MGSLAGADVSAKSRRRAIRRAFGSEPPEFRLLHKLSTDEFRSSPPSLAAVVGAWRDTGGADIEPVLTAIPSRAGLRKAIDVVQAIPASFAGRDIPLVEVPELTALAFGLDGSSMVARNALLGSIHNIDLDVNGRLFERGPGPDFGPDNPGAFPPIPTDLVQKVWDGLVESLYQAIEAFRSSGVDEYNTWVLKATTDVEGIRDVAPKKACAGDVIEIAGQFPETCPEFTRVIVGRDEVEIVSWTSALITIVVPEDAKPGCIAFRHTAGPPPPIDDSRFREEAGTVGELIGSDILVAGNPGSWLASAQNGISGDPLPVFEPEGDIRLSDCYVFIGPPTASLVSSGYAFSDIADFVLTWETEGADEVQLVLLDGDHGFPEPPAGPLEPVGSWHPDRLPMTELDDWEAFYELRAVNRCSPKATTALVRIVLTEGPSIPGLVDTHVHFAAHLNHGGAGIRGLPHPKEVYADAAQRLGHAVPNCEHGFVGGLFCLENSVHDPAGYPTFADWPTHDTLAHQQAHIDWIMRAWDGGLRLVVSLAVNNELLPETIGKIIGAPYKPYDDKSAIVRQVAAMRDLVEYARSLPEPYAGFIEIADSAESALSIIKRGKLAMVFGVEVDSLGWHTETELTDAARNAGREPNDLIDDLTDWLWQKGIRYVFPLHGTNNAFGGAAIFNGVYDPVNVLNTGSSFIVEPAPPGSKISFRMDQVEFPGGDIARRLSYYPEKLKLDFASTIVATLGHLVQSVGLKGLGDFLKRTGVGGTDIAELLTLPVPPGDNSSWTVGETGHINAQKLTDHGEHFIRSLAAKGMMIDIDHMGYHTLQSTLTVCEHLKYPVFSGHTGFRDLRHGGNPVLGAKGERPKPFQAGDLESWTTYGTNRGSSLSSEVDKSSDDLKRVRSLQGFVSPILYQGDGETCGCYTNKTVNDSSGSSKSLAQAIAYAAFYMKNKCVGLGSDMNGAGRLPGPRFGPGGSSGLHDPEAYRPRWYALWQHSKLAVPSDVRADQVFGQDDAVAYDSPIRGYSTHRFKEYRGDGIALITGMDNNDGAPFDADQRDFWEALVIQGQGINPSKADIPNFPLRSAATAGKIVNFGYGLRAKKRSEIPTTIPWSPTRPYLTNEDEQLAAFLALRHDNPQFGSPWLRDDDNDRFQQLYYRLKPVADHWRTMTENARSTAKPWSTLYDKGTGRLKRSVSGARQWDINIDGMVHIGMYPDLLQDLENVHAPTAVLMRSAHDFIRTWARCQREGRRLSSGHE
jgi:hypothetical protein